MLERIYAHFGDGIVFCGAVGLSHAGEAGQKPNLAGLGGARQSPFLVFTANKAAQDYYGKAKSNKLLRESSAAFDAQLKPLFKAQRCFGPEATKDVFDRTAKGELDSTVTYVCSMWPEHLHEPDSGTAAGATSKL